MRAFVALLLLLVASSAGAAPDDTCTITGACDMASITDGNCAPEAGSISCVGGDLALGVDDLFVLNGGTNEVQGIANIGGSPSGGTYQICLADQTTCTTALDYDSAAVTVRREVLEAFGWSREELDVITSIGPTSPFTQVRYGGARGCQDVTDLLWLKCSNLTGFSCTDQTFDEGTKGAATVGDPGDLTISGNFTFDAVTSGTGIHVQCGSSLTAEVASGATTDLAIVLPIGDTFTGLAATADVGLRVDSGGTVTMKGRRLSLDTLVPTLEVEQTDGTQWTVGQVVPCFNTAAPSTTPGACATYGQYEGWFYDDLKTFVVPSGCTNCPAPYWSASMAAISPADDVIRFYDPSFGRAERIARDVFASYEIVSVDTTSGAGWIVVDIRHGEIDQDGFPFTRRDITSTTLAAAATKGDTTLEISAAFMAAGSELDYGGRCVRLSDGSGDPIGPPYHIMHIVDASDAPTANDEIRLLDTRGVRHDLASGQIVWLDYCHTEGDIFEIIRPVRVSSATTPTTTARSEDSYIHAYADAGFTLHDTVIEEIGLLEFRSGAPNIERTWFKDTVWGDDDGTTMWLSGTDPMTLGPGLSMTGGSDLTCELEIDCSAAATPYACCTGVQTSDGSCACPDNNYGIGAAEAGLVTLRDSLIQERGDDYFVLSQSSVQDDEESEGFAFERVVARWVSSNASSGQFYDAGVNVESLALNNVININTSSHDGVAPVFMEETEGGPRSCTVTGMFNGSMFSSMQHSAGERHCRATNFMFAGGFFSPPTRGGVEAYQVGQFVLPYTNQFVVRDNWNQEGTSSGTAVRYTRPMLAHVQNGYFLRNMMSVDGLASNQTPSFGPKTFDNVGFFDTTFAQVPGDDVLNLSVVADDTTETIFKNITFAWHPDFDWSASGTYGSVTAGNNTNLVMESFLMAYSDPQETPPYNTPFSQSDGKITSEGRHAGDWCFFFNTKDLYGNTSHINLEAKLAADATNPGNLYRNIDPSFVNPWDDNWAMAKGGRLEEADCGMKAGAGIKRRLWFHSVLGIEPEYQGLLGAGGAGGGDQDNF
jgi:hypothetical protein